MKKEKIIYKMDQSKKTLITDTLKLIDANFTNLLHNKFIDFEKVLKTREMLLKYEKSNFTGDHLNDCCYNQAGENFDVPDTCKCMVLLININLINEILKQEK